MNGLRKINLKYPLSLCFTGVLFFTQTLKSTDRIAYKNNFCTALTQAADTIPQIKKEDTVTRRRQFINPNALTDTVPRTRSGTDTLFVREKTDTFSLKLSKDSLDAPVNYEAEDSAVVLIDDKKIILYGKTRTNYKDIELTAPQVEMDQETQIVTAMNRKDSAGVVVERAHFKDNTQNFQSDTIRFNFKTQKGLTRNTYTPQQEFHVISDYLKKVNDNTVFAGRTTFSTCNYDEPHFAFRTRKMKIVSNKVAVSGPVGVEFEGVPLPPPVGLPFGFFPLTKGRHGGFLPPQFTVNEDFGLGLEGIGYYFAPNDYIDITTRANIYSYGGWSATITPAYRKRYRYNGRLNFTLQTTKLNFKGDPDFSKTKTFQVNWSHAVDSRARPGTNFSASVTAGSTKYNDFIPNNPNLNFQNQLNSSITYSKTWQGKPYNLTISANHNQNNRTRLVNLNLPDVGFTVSTLYPFQKKQFAGSPKWYEKLGVAYNGNVRSQVSFYDTAFQFRQLIDTLQWGGQHNFPVTLSLPPLGPFLVAPSISYEQKWIAQTFRRSWNDNTKKLDTAITKGFFVDQRVSTGLSFSTGLFGTFNFKKSGTAIRHIVRPSVGFSYTPSLSKNNFYETQVDTFGRKLRFSQFEGSLYGFYGEQDFGGMSFSIDNNLEMKYRSKKDSGEAAVKKIRLIDGFGVSSGYNFIADSFKLSAFSFYLRSTLFDKINITASASLNPYQTDSLGYPIDKYAWQGGRFSLGRFTTGNLSVSTRFQSKPKDPEKQAEKEKRENEFLNDPLLADEQRRLTNYIRQNPGEFVDFNIPWSVDLSLSVFFSERLKADYSGYEKDFSSNLNFSGNFNLTPKWNFGANGYYDFDTRQLQTLQFNISREMHCWQMTIGVTPVGPVTFFNISISPKASILQDLRINRTRYFYGN